MLCLRSTCCCQSRLFERTKLPPAEGLILHLHQALQTIDPTSRSSKNWWDLLWGSRGDASCPGVYKWCMYTPLLVVSLVPHQFLKWPFWSFLPGWGMLGLQSFVMDIQYHYHVCWPGSLPTTLEESRGSLAALCCTPPGQMEVHVSATSAWWCVRSLQGQKWKVANITRPQLSGQVKCCWDSNVQSFQHKNPCKGGSDFLHNHDISWPAVL